MATRHRDFASLYRKVLTMKKRLGEKRDDKPETAAETQTATG
jgi:hypothetical protein